MTEESKELSKLRKTTPALGKPSLTTGGTKVPHSWAESHFQEHPRRILEAFFDADQKRNGFFAINDAVIVTECQIHHGANFYFTIDRNRALLDGMHT
jgi:hypothetical protein